MLKNYLLTKTQLFELIGLFFFLFTKLQTLNLTFLLQRTANVLSTLTLWRVSNKQCLFSVFHLIHFGNV